MFKCRYPRCGKSFSDKSNYRRRERKERLPAHQKEEFLPQCRRKAATSFFDTSLSIWYYPGVKLS